MFEVIAVWLFFLLSLFFTIRYYTFLIKEWYKEKNKQEDKQNPLNTNYEEVRIVIQQNEDKK